MEPDPREKKLPRWAQDQLRALRMRLKDTNDALTAAVTGDGESRAFIRRPHEVNDWLMLPDHYIRFRVAGIDFDVSPAQDGFGLSIRTNQGRLMVLPDCSNVIAVKAGSL